MHLLIFIQEKLLSSVPLSLQMFDASSVSRLLIFQNFCSSFSFSHLLVYNLLSQEFHFIIHSSCSFLLLFLLISGRRVHYGHSDISLQCHKHHWLLESKSTLIGEKLKDGFLLPQWKITATEIVITLANVPIWAPYWFFENQYNPWVHISAHMEARPHTYVHTNTHAVYDYISFS